MMGYRTVYTFMGDHTFRLKVGGTEKDANDRFSGSRPTWCSEPVTLLGQVRGPSYLEKETQDRLKDLDQHIVGEWFKPTPTTYGVLHQIGVLDDDVSLVKEEDIQLVGDLEDFLPYSSVPDLKTIRNRFHEARDKWGSLVGVIYALRGINPSAGNYRHGEGKGGWSGKDWGLSNQLLKDHNHLMSHFEKLLAEERAEMMQRVANCSIDPGKPEKVSS